MRFARRSIVAAEAAAYKQPLRLTVPYKEQAVRESAMCNRRFFVRRCEGEEMFLVATAAKNLGRSSGHSEWRRGSFRGENVKQKKRLAS
jgi:hypothetical protein